MLTIYLVIITINPYQGLKLGGLAQCPVDLWVIITINPYQGLKRSIEFTRIQNY